MDPDVRDKILSRPRAEELAKLEPWEPTIPELRQKYGADISDEDLILLAIVGDDALDVVGSSSQKNYHLSSTLPLAELIHGLANRDNNSFVNIKKKNFSLTMIKPQ